MERSAMKTTVLLAVCVLLSMSQSRNVVSAQLVDCFIGENCTELSLEESLTFDGCCLELGYQSYVTSSGQCSPCSSAVVEFSETSYSVDEGAGVVALELVRYSDSSSELVVSITLRQSGGRESARGGFDFGFFPEEEITFTTVFLVNETTMNFGVRIVDDNIVEADETFTASLSLPSEDALEDLGYVFNPNPDILNIGRRGSTTVTIVDNDFVNITMSPEFVELTESEDNQPIEFVLRKEGLSERAIEVIAFTRNISFYAVDGQDYIGLMDTLFLFEPDVFERRFTVTILDDSVVESVEEFSVMVVAGDGERGVKFPTGQLSTVNILDDNDTVEFLFQPMEYTVTEDETDAPIIVVQVGDTERPVTFRVMYDRQETTATEGTDFTIDEGVISNTVSIGSRIISSGETLEIPVIQLLKDGRYEPDEIIQLDILPAEGETAVVGGAPATVTIIDSDVVTIGFVDSAIVADEPSSFNVSVVLLENNLDPGTAISLDIRAVDGVASGGDDYSFSFDSDQFSFTPGGDSMLNVGVEIIDDNVFEGREDFELVLSSQQPRVVFTSQQIIEITDNEDLLIDFDMNVYEVSETDEILSVEIELISMIEREIQLLLRTRDGRATGGEDYEPVSQNLTFLPNSRNVTSQIILYDDDINEGLEEFLLQLVLTDTQLGRPGVLRESTVRINDNEVTFVEFARETYTVSEGQSFVVLVVNKTGVTQEDVPVMIELADGTARAGDFLDYGPFNSPSLSVMARLFADEVSIPFGVLIREDRRLEYEEFFTATLTLPPIEGSNVQLGSMRNTTVVIKDNDMINVTISPIDQEVQESVAQVTLTISRSDDLILDRNVVVIVSAIADTAVEESDFRAEDMQLTFTEDGPRSFEYTVEILQDDIAEGLEQLTVQLSTLPGEAGVDFHTDSSLLRIIDDDVALVQFSKNLFEGDEINGEVEICLTKDVQTSSGFQVTLLPQETVPNPPDTFQARANIDFDDSPVTVSFAPGDMTACGRIVIINDSQIGETREVFSVLLRLPEDVPYIELGPMSTATVEVTDTPDVMFGFERSTLEVSETVTDIEVCVRTFNPGQSEPLDGTVDFEVVSLPGTAGSSDYELVGAGSGTIDNSTRRVCFTVQIVDDMLFEESLETFSLMIQIVNVIGTREDGRMLRVLDSPDRINISIVDDDRSVVIGFESIDFTVEEQNGPVQLCVSVFRPTMLEEFDASIDIIAATISGSAGPSDYVPISAVDRDVVLTFNNATRRACFNVEIVEDSIFEEEEQFTVQLTIDALDFDGTPQSISLSPASATVTIFETGFLLVGFEDDSLDRRVLQNAGTISLCVVVVSDRDITTNFSVTIVFSGGTADPQVDFLLESNLILSFDAVTRRQCFDVEIISDDDTDEEYFEISVLLVQFIPGILIDDDRETARVTITPMTTTPPPILVNDTVIGDPLFTVPLNLENGYNLLPRIAKTLDGFPNLCYEIHGEHDRHFNLVSDTCTMVNAHYNMSDSPDLRGWNVISTIGIRAVNSRQQCVNINVGVENECMPVVAEDGLAAVTTPRYQAAGITVSKHRNQVRVSVPNCRNIQLVMWISCQSLSSFPMIRYDITRGINLRPTSHGLLGQFWNVPIGIDRYVYTGTQEIDYLDLDSLYAVTVAPPLASRNRTFIAELYTFTWEPRNEVCFYAGNIQGGRLREITDRNFNDPVIEGSYEDYIVEGLFEHEFAYSQFSADMC